MPTVPLHAAQPVFSVLIKNLSLRGLVQIDTWGHLGNARVSAPLCIVPSAT